MTAIWVALITQTGLILVAIIQTTKTSHSTVSVIDRLARLETHVDHLRDTVARCHVARK